MRSLRTPHFFCTMEDINDNTKNLYVIKRRLAELKKRTGYNDYVYYVGNFIIYIFTNRIQEPTISCDPDDSIVKYKKLDITLQELSKKDVYRIVDLISDPRFAEYKPILYNYWEGPYGITNMGDGHDMPLNSLCELIKYLHRLSNLTAFM